MISNTEKQRFADICAVLVQAKIELKQADLRSQKRRDEALAADPGAVYSDLEGDIERQKLRKAVLEVQRTLDEAVFAAVSERLQTG